MGIKEFRHGLTAAEQIYIENITQDLPDKEKNLFLTKYKMRRKNPFTFSMLSLAAAVGVGGLQRFYINNSGMGLLYILSFGGLLVGNFYDLLHCSKICASANIAVADEVYNEVIGLLPSSSVIKK